MNPPGKTAALQRTLAAGGFYTGRIDDDFGPLTQAADRKSTRLNSSHT